MKGERNQSLSKYTHIPHYRCGDCGDGRWHAGGMATVEAHYAEAHPGKPVNVEQRPFGSEGYYNPAPNPQDVRKDKKR